MGGNIGIGGNTRGVRIDGGKAIRRQGTHQFKFGLLDVLQTTESLEVHRSDGRDNADGRMDQIADFPDISRLLGAHLDDEHLMVGL